MIAPDANLLIYAYTPEDPFHHPSRKWLEEILSGSESVGIPILSIQAFLRVQTSPRGRSPVTLEKAAAAVESWIDLPHVRILYPGERHWTLYRQLASQARMKGAELTDAAIAAIAMEHGATVYTYDSDFARFPGLRWKNPLQA